VTLQSLTVDEALPGARRPGNGVCEVPASEELAEHDYLLRGGLGSGRLRDQGKQSVGCRSSECAEFAPEGIQPAPCQPALFLQARDPGLLASNRLPKLFR